jgi:probable F420-dependent oxidoreductase
MTHPRPFRFGVQVPPAPTGREWLEQAKKIEALGYTSLSVADHIGGRFGWAPALMAVATTTSLRVGTLVLDNDFRLPSLTITDANTIDIISDGRFELGIGAGWDPEDYTRSGIPFDRPGVRVERLVESLEIMKTAWRGEPVNFSGKYYNMVDFRLNLMPVQKPHPPILIGAGGKRLLSVAAKMADIVGIAPPAGKDGGIDMDIGAATVQRQVDHLRAEAGDRFDQIELQMLNQALEVTDNPASTIAEKAAAWNVSEEVIADSPHVLFGTMESMIETLYERRERYGFSYYVVRPPVMEQFAPIVAKLTGK